MITAEHPYFFLSPLFKKQGVELSFSRYIYTPDSFFDERECFSLTGTNVTEDWVAAELAALRPGQELALHSKIRLGGKNFHIPMIDFSTEEAISAEVFDRMGRYLPKALMLNMAVYASGRSFHAYSTTLLSPKEWYEFMGRLLLINPRAHTEIVDTRWIGHRLIGGFSSLRWSNNSSQYIGIPTRISFPG